MFKKLKESFGDKFIDNCALVFTHWQNSESKIEEREEKNISRLSVQ
jgi:hypothetical protein